MMAQKYLHELLQEDQEPFLLNKYISDRRSQLIRPSPKTSLQVKKRKPIHDQNSNFAGNFCKNACFFSFPDTPDIRKSPLFEFASPAKSPCKSPNPIFLRIPARTAALLLEAALRIQKQSSSKTKSQNKNNAFGLFGSFFKRLAQRNRNRKREIEGNGVKVSVKDILRWDSSVGRRKLSNGSRTEREHRLMSVKDKTCSDVGAYEVGFSCSHPGRSSSVAWSETNEDKSLDMETSSSSQSDDTEEIDFVSKQKDYMDRFCCENDFCESPFRFILQRSPSSGRQTPDLASPVSSPLRHRTEDKENNGTVTLTKFHSGVEVEEKEQCSPVSILDPPFEDDDYRHENDDDEGDGFDSESSYAIVQRTKQQLLYKLRRFEKLAELDPVELEKRMLDEDDDEETFIEEDDCDDEDGKKISDKDMDFKGLVVEVLCQSNFHDRRQNPEDLKRLVSDLIMEEERQVNSLEDGDMVVRSVCKRLELWKEVESNTIDMMIEQDFCREDVGWKKNVEQMRELAGDLELAIFGFLVEEFSEELVC